MLGKLRWVIIFVSFKILKIALRYRLTGDSEIWVQSLPFLNPKIVNRKDYIIDYCEQKKVLHVGFTDFPFTIERLKMNKLLHTKIKAKASLLIGVDNNQESINSYINFTNDNNVYYVDILKVYNLEIAQNDFDVIVLGEVLEHLQNPGHALAIIAQTFKPNTKVLVTVPNYTSLDSISASLNNKESIHPHHYWYFSPYTLNRLFVANGFTCQEMFFGMYYDEQVGINSIIENNAFNGDCIIGIFNLNTSQKNES
jgi:SAM-dependent methyltransferase